MVGWAGNPLRGSWNCMRGSGAEPPYCLTAGEQGPNSDKPIS